jgi:hypothetical protein
MRKGSKLDLFLPLVMIGILLPNAVPAAGAAEAIELRFKFSPGAISTYRMHAEQETEAQSDLSPGTVQKTSIDTKAVLREKITSVSSGSASVELSFDSFSARQLIAGKAYPVDGGDEFRKIRIGLTMSGLGELSGVHVLNPDEIKHAARRAAESICLSLSRQVLMLPERPVVPGDSWQVEKKIPSILPGVHGLDMRLTSSYKFIGTKKVRGRNCARIEARVSLSLQGKAERAGVPIAAELTGEGKGESLVAIEAGLLLSSQSRMVISGDLTAGTKGQIVKTNIKVALKTGLDLK